MIWVVEKIAVVVCCIMGALWKVKKGPRKRSEKYGAGGNENYIPARTADSLLEKRSNWKRVYRKNSILENLQKKPDTELKFEEGT